MEVKLLASSQTIEGIERMVNKYACSDSYVVHVETLEIVNVKGSPVPKRWRIVRKGKRNKLRYRFEYVRE